MIARRDADFVTGETMEPGNPDLIGVIGRGLLIGLVLAVPVGPIGMLCIVRTLRFGRAIGLATGLGAATADAIYAAIALLGLTTLTTVLVAAQKPLAIGGAIALGLIGLRTMRTPATSAPPDATGGMPSGRPAFRMTWLGTVALTLANPATILTFVGIFAGISATINADSRFLVPMLMVASVFVGSTCWWVVLTGGVHALRRRWFADGPNTSPHTRLERMRRLHLLSGGVLIAFGAFAAIHALT